jgi:hypothetical protein
MALSGHAFWNALQGSIFRPSFSNPEGKDFFFPETVNKCFGQHFILLKYPATDHDSSRTFVQ